MRRRALKLSDRTRTAAAIAALRRSASDSQLCVNFGKSGKLQTVNFKFPNFYIDFLSKLTLNGNGVKFPNLGKKKKLNNLKIFKTILKR